MQAASVAPVETVELAVSAVTSESGIHRSCKMRVIRLRTEMRAIHPEMKVHGVLPLLRCERSGNEVRMDKILQSGTYGKALSCIWDDAEGCEVHVLRERTDIYHHTCKHQLLQTVDKVLSYICW